MKFFLQSILAVLARRIIKKYNPTIIGITGSVGKTSAKEAVFRVVSQKFNTRRAAKNFNDQLGLPLAIIGITENPEKNPLKWLHAIARGLEMVLLSYPYPSHLVLEYGIDHPGDMDYLLSIARPHYAVITNIGMVHYEFFDSAEAIEREKGKLAAGIRPGGMLVLNADDETAMRQHKRFSGKTLYYSTAKQADVYVTKRTEYYELPAKTDLVIQTPATEIQATIQAVGESHVSAVVCAVTLGVILGIDPFSIARGLQEYKPEPGRLNLIAGIKHSILIDDTYNASPHAVVSALNVLIRTPGKHKVAVLGDMLELGSISAQEHRNIAYLISHIPLDLLVTVGDKARHIAEDAKTHGIAENHVFSYDTADEAKIPLQNMLEPESVVLLKGSQSMRMEKITKEIMAEPLRAGELLCRQYGKWLRS